MCHFAGYSIPCKMAVHDEQALLNRLLAFTGKENNSQKAAQEKVLRDATNRIRFVEDASKRLFEEKLSGTMPDSLYRKMFADYEKELTGLEAQVADLRHEMRDDASSEADVQRWLAMVKECLTLETLDRATAFQLIDHVDVLERADENGHITHTIQVKYNFVGYLS